MSRLLNKQPNIPRAILEDYFYLIAGIPKSGKTTLFAKLIEKYYGDINKGLLIAFEKGYQALRVIAEDVGRWEDFEDIVDELIEYKDELPYKFIGIDTADRMWDMAQDKVIREWNAKNPSKRTNDIGAVGAKGNSDSGYGVGYANARKKIWNNLDRLMKAGYGIMVLTHSSDKKVKQKDGLEYDQLVCSLSGSAREVFVNAADFIVFLTIEKEKSGKEIETNRLMYFRTDGYVEAGSRFQNVPSEPVEYSVENFIEVFNNAIMFEFEVGTDINKIRKEQEAEKEKRTAEYLEAEKNKEPSVEELIEELDGIVAEATSAEKKEYAEIIKDILGIKNYRKATDASLLQQCIEEIKSK